MNVLCPGMTRAIMESCGSYKITPRDYTEKESQAEVKSQSRSQCKLIFQRRWHLKTGLMSVFRLIQVVNHFLKGCLFVCFSSGFGKMFSGHQRCRPKRFQIYFEFVVMILPPVRLLCFRNCVTAVHPIPAPQLA